MKRKIFTIVLGCLLLLNIFYPKVYAADCPTFLYVNNKYITIWTGFAETTANGFASSPSGRSSTLGIKKSSYGRITWYVGTDLYRYDIVNLRISIYVNGEATSCNYSITMK